MSSSRRYSLLAAGWMCLSLMLSGSGCELTLATSERDSARTKPATYEAKPSSAPKRDASPENIQVAYQQAPNTMNGVNVSPIPSPTVMPPGTSTMPPGTTMMQPGPGCGPGGCAGGGQGEGAGQGIPVELGMTSHPPYIIEPPDILLLTPIRMIPKPPYTVGPLDVLLLRAAKAVPDQPVEGTYTIGPDGSINLGYSYGLVRVGGLTLEDVEKVIRAQLRRSGVTDPQIAVGLAQFRGVQQVLGQHLVRQDGTIALGSYGCVYIVGLTLNQAKVAIERHLAQYLQDPEISVDVGVYNSKYYYVVTDGAGYGQSVFRFPITGKETVLDGLTQIGGVPAVGSKKKIWVARPAPANHGCSQILPVDWTAISQAGVTATNYQLFPGDRIFVQSDSLIWLDNTLATAFAPIERIFGFTLLGATAYSSVKNVNSTNGNGGGAAFIAPLR